jgi:hypothetical protein
VQFAGGGSPRWTPEMSAPSIAHLLAERRQRHGGSDPLRAPHVLQVDLALLAVVRPGGTTSAACGGRRPREAAEQPLEQRRSRTTTSTK